MVSEDTENSNNNTRRAPEDSATSGKAFCFECNRSLNRSRHLVNVAGKLHRWHSECFRCHLCKVPLERESSCHVYGERIICVRDYAKLRSGGDLCKQLQSQSRECCRCKWPIAASDWVRRVGHFVYHLACFSCDVCLRQLSTGEQFTIDELTVARTGTASEQSTSQDTPNASTQTSLDSKCIRIVCRRHFKLRDARKLYHGRRQTSTSGARLPLGHSNEPELLGGDELDAPNKHRHAHDDDQRSLSCSNPEDELDNDEYLDRDDVINNNPLDAENHSQLVTADDGSCEGCPGGQLRLSSPQQGDHHLNHQSHHNQQQLFPLSHPHGHGHRHGHAHGHGHGHGGSQKSLISSLASKSKRVRTTFTEDQLSILQTHFQIDSNPDGQDLERIATITGLSKRVTQVWFQNSRARQKKYLIKRKPGSSTLMSVSVSVSGSGSVSVSGCSGQTGGHHQMSELLGAPNPASCQEPNMAHSGLPHDYNMAMLNGAPVSGNQSLFQQSVSASSSSSSTTNNHHLVLASHQAPTFGSLVASSGYDNSNKNNNNHLMAKSAAQNQPDQIIMASWSPTDTNSSDMDRSCESQSSSPRLSNLEAQDHENMDSNGHGEVEDEEEDEEDECEQEDDEEDDENDANDENETMVSLPDI